MTDNAVGQLKTKKPWYMKWWVWLIAAVVLVGTISNLAGGGDKNEGTTPETPAANLVQIPDVAGMPAKDAKEALTDAGFKVTYDGGEKTVFAASNWDARGTEPAAGEEVEKGSRIKLIVAQAEERLAAEKAERDAAAAERNAEIAATPLEVVDAQVFCEGYTDKQFPFGVKLHTVVGKLAEQQTDTGWYMKFRATATNEYNAKQELNVECHMSGTNGAPVMDEWLAY